MHACMLAKNERKKNFSSSSASSLSSQFSQPFALRPSMQVDTAAVAAAAAAVAVAAAAVVAAAASAIFLT